MTLQPGTRLGPYEVVSPLGKGGMGEVYKAVDPRLGRSVAIKVVAEARSASAGFRERLEREARTISRLQHPNICTLHDIGSADGVPYLVMEYLEGETLAERLVGGPLPLAAVLAIGGEVADAVCEAHKYGIVHRDLKPGNVMLGPAGTKVLDFGLAQPAQVGLPTGDFSAAPTLTEPTSPDGAVAGTVPYMAPEQLEGKRVDLRTDIWALGCILYEMATGERPFRGDSRAALISAIMTSAPVLMTETQPLLPPRLAWVVSRCLEKDPERRWQSARDVAMALQGVAEETDTAPLEGGVAAVSSRQRRSPAHRRMPWKAAAALVAAAVALVWAAYRLRSPALPDPVAVEGTAVAVLPFENLTGDEQISYLGPGLAAGLISELSALPGINVIGRSHAWSAYRDTEAPSELAEMLGVNVVVEGEIRSAAGGLEVSLSALDGVSARALWSDTFAGSREDLYELQQRIVRSVARVLSVPLSAEDRRRFSRAGPPARAFDYYLQGIERSEQRANPRHLEFAADLFRQAIRIEGGVAIFHAALSNTISQQRLEGRPERQAEEAEEEARRALELDPHLPEAHLAMARALRFQGRHAESIAELRPILAQHPKPDEAFLELAFGYEETGDTEAAFQALQSAVAIGPENWFNWNALGVTQAEFGRVDEARASLEKALELAPASVTWPRLNLGGVKTLLGDYAGAIEDFEATGAVTTNPDLASNMATAYYFQGRLDRAESLYRVAVSLDPDNFVLHRNLGDALLALDRKEEATEAFRAALRLVEAELVDQPRSDVLLRSRALYAAKVGDCEAALPYARAARPYLLESWKGQLDLAMTFALCGQRADALEAVRACLELGLPGSILREQSELQALAEDEEFLALTDPT